MKLKRTLLVVGVFIASTTLPAFGQAYNAKDKKQMRQLAFDACVKTNAEKLCNCFADSLVKSFKEKDWSIFIADTAKKASAPAGMTEEELDSYGSKIAAAGNSCGLQ